MTRYGIESINPVQAEAARVPPRELHLVRGNKEVRFSAIAGCLHLDEFLCTIEPERRNIVTSTIAFDECDVTNALRKVLAAVVAQPLLLVCYDRASPARPSTRYLG